MKKSLLLVYPNFSFYKKCSIGLLFMILTLYSTSFSQNFIPNGSMNCTWNNIETNYTNSGLSNPTLPGSIAITSNPNLINSSWASFYDHTSGDATGSMLVVDGYSNNSGSMFWKTGTNIGGGNGIQLIGGTTYIFSYWVKAVSDIGNNAIIQAQWNNATVLTSPPSIVAPSTVAQGWVKYSYTFKANGSGNSWVQINLSDANTSGNGNGNDFAIDDFSVTLAVAPALTLTVAPTNPSCYIKGSDATDGTDGAIIGYAGGGIAPYSFSLTQTEPAPSVPIGTNTTGSFPNLISGLYTLSVTDAGSTVKTVTGIKIGNLEDTIKKIKDTTICQGSSVQLTVSGGYNGGYIWNPATSLPDNAPIVTPAATTTYTVETDTTINFTSAQNLIYNGGFESYSSGITGFYSDYTHLDNNDATKAQKVYGIVTNPTTFESGFSNCTTHSGTYQMVVDGSTFVCGVTGSDIIWAQTVKVVPGTTYTLTYYFRTVSSAGNPAQLVTKINGAQVGTTTTATAATCGAWTTFTQTWVAGAGITSAAITLYDINAIAAGNDFAIDDISFIGTSSVSKTCKLKENITVTVLPPTGPVISCGTSTTNSVTFNWSAVTGATSYNISYTINNGTTQNGGSVTGTTFPVNSLTAGDSVSITITPVGTGCFIPATSFCKAITCTPPTVTLPADFSVCNNATVAATNFVSTPAGATYSWTNSNTAIGLAASGNGNVPSFTAANTSASNITATITVTPTLTCAGTPVSYIITVKPTPAAPAVSVTNYCNGTSDLTASSYTGTLLWSNSQTSGTITVNNAATYTVTQTVNGCISPNGSGTSAPNTNPAAPTASVTVQPTCTVGGTIVISAPLGANLEYSVNGTTYQSSVTFSGLSAAAYSVTVRNKVSLCVSSGTPLTVNAPPGAPATPTASVTAQPTCTTPTGTVTVTAPTGANIQYSNGGAYQISGTFSNLTPGTTYTISAKDVSTGCISSGTSLTIDAIPANPATPTASITVQPTCTTPKGTIVVTAPTGANIQYSNGGAYQSGGTFSNLNPGTTYLITAKNTVTGCTSANTSLTIDALPANPATPTASITVQPTCTSPTGTIVVTAPTGANIQYSNGGAYQSGGTFSNLNPGTTYLITAKNTATGCISTSASFTIDAIPVNPATPTASITVQPTCTSPTGTIVITAPTGANIQYSDGGAYQISGTFSNLNPGTTYLITAKNTATGCISASNSLTIDIIPGAPATPTASVTVQPTCTTPTGTIVVTAPTGANIEYSDGGAYQTSGTFSNLTPGTTYLITAKNTATGCISGSITLNVNAIPANPAAPTASITVQPTCTTPTGTIVVTAPTGANIEYSDGGTYQTGGTFSNLTPGTTYLITAKNTVTGCISANTSLTVDAIPANPATPTASITVQPTCTSPTGTIVVTAPTGANIQYSNGGAYQSSGTFPNLNPGTTYLITAKNTATGCISANNSLTIDIIPGAPATPTAGITAQPTCTTPTGTIVVTAPTGANIQYSNGGTYQSSGNFSNLTPGTTYLITAKNTATGCISASISFTIDAIPANPAAPTASVVAEPTCITPTGTIAITAPTGANIQYSDGGTYQVSGTFSNLAPGSNYILRAKDIATGCLSNTTSLSVNPLPSGPSAPVATVITQPDCNTPQGTISISSPAGISIEYSINGGSYQGSPDFTGLAPAGTYTLRAKDNVTGCVSATSAINVSALPALPATPIASVTVQPTCFSPSGTILISAPSGGNIEYNINGSAYQSNNTFNGLNPGGSYSITARNTMTGCVSSIKNISVNSLPASPATPTALVSSQPTCLIPTGTIKISNPSGPAIVYSIDGSTYQVTKIYSGLEPGQNFSVTSKDNSTGCVSAPANLSINPVPADPVVSAGPDKEILEGQSTQLEGQISGNNIKFIWTPNISIINAKTLTPTVSPLSDQTYVLTATSADGCVGSDEVKVIVQKEINVPNVFSPNGDNINDTWEITNINYYPKAVISIFNRYGQFLFESIGYNAPWDGLYKGKPVPVGTYFWVIKLKADSKPISGSISVIR